MSPAAVDAADDVRNKRDEGVRRYANPLFLFGAGVRQDHPFVTVCDRVRRARDADVRICKQGRQVLRDERRFNFRLRARSIFNLLYC